MKFRVLMLGLTLAAIGVASAQQPPRLPAQRPSILQVSPSGTISDASAVSENCRSTPFGATVVVSATVALPETDATVVSFEVVEGTDVRATGEAPIARVVRPDGTRTGPPVARIEAQFDVTGTSGSGSAQIRLTGGMRGASAPIAYSWSCITRAPVAPGTVALPDLTFDQNFLMVHMYREASPAGVSDLYQPAPGQDVLFWDREVCRGANSSWTIVGLRVIARNVGAPGSNPEMFEVEARVAGAPELTERQLTLMGPRHRHSVREFLVRARAQSANQDSVQRMSLRSSDFLNVRGAAAQPINRLDVPLPCGEDRTIELILDPGNVVQESNENNNRLTIRYDLLG